MKKIKIPLLPIFLLIAGLLMFSCMPLRKVKYLQERSATDTLQEFGNIKPDYKLQPGNYLYIRIMSLDEKSNQVFSSITGTQNSYGQQSDQNVYLTSYMIDKEGFVTFPVLGRVSAMGYTVTELEKILGEKVNEIMKEASVVVKLVHFEISVLGEVKSPGKYPIYSDRVNIFEAMAMAGDLSTYANRNKIQVIRSNGEQNNVVTIDLSRKDVLASPYYYLQPNDIIYIEPLKNKSYAFETFPYSLVFSTITTLLVVVTFFKK